MASSMTSLLVLMDGRVQVKRALFDGGIARSNKPEGIRNTPGIQEWSDLVGSFNSTADSYHCSVTSFILRRLVYTPLST
jgi:hypothetical protein